MTAGRSGWVFFLLGFHPLTEIEAELGAKFEFI